jgi:terminase small subunit / prophage DNA-packing protein
MLVNRQELSTAMGVSLPTVDRWIRDGCPVKQRGAKGVPWEFSLPDVVAWWGNRQREAASGDSMADEAELKRRKLAAETAKSELELAQARGLVAPVREFERAQAAVMAAIRQNILNVPARAVLQLLGCTDETEFKQKLRVELALALEQSADADIALDDEAEDDEAEG